MMGIEGVARQVWKPSWTASGKMRGLTVITSLSVLPIFGLLLDVGREILAGMAEMGSPRRGRWRELCAAAIRCGESVPQPMSLGY